VIAVSPPDTVVSGSQGDLESPAGMTSSLIVGCRAMVSARRCADRDTAVRGRRAAAGELKQSPFKPVAVVEVDRSSAL